MKKLLKKWVNQFFTTSPGVQEPGLVIPHRQLNWVVAILLFFGVGSFVAGFFWGQRKAVEYFIKRIEEDSFADRISYALYTMNDRDSVEFEDTDSADNEALDANQTVDTDDDTLLDSAENGTDAGTENSEETQEVLEEAESHEELPSFTTEMLQDKAITAEELGVSAPLLDEKNPDLLREKSDKLTVYLARLAGFGTLQGARIFADRVKALDKGACVVEHISKSLKGRKMKWYQVVTSEFNDKEALQHLVSRIQHKEHISDVQIIDRKKG